MSAHKLNVFKKLGLGPHPVMLAPLAGVSDHPFRRICQENGADLTYVEMISATALLHDSPRTLRMLERHPSEPRLGVQITGKSALETAEAIARLDGMDFDTIDINMGCPVKKVVKTGCGSAILKDVDRVYETVSLARKATKKPLSAKIRLGWDQSSANGVAIAEAIAQGGADWVTVHGRTRACDYSAPVQLSAMAQICEAVSIPVIGNGNLFSPQDVHFMRERTGVQGVMISRGALGNPFLFNQIRGLVPVSLRVWYDVVSRHLDYQQRAYGDRGMAAICMRKHLLWYTKGWSGGKRVREAINQTDSLAAAREVLDQFFRELEPLNPDRIEGDQNTKDRFQWDPKYEMDRRLDRGVGDDGFMA